MQIGPSNNLLDALSQLQSSVVPPRTPAPGASTRGADFAAEVKRTLKAEAEQQLPDRTSTQAAPVQLSGNLATLERPDYPQLGRHINILV